MPSVGRLPEKERRRVRREEATKRKRSIRPDNHVTKDLHKTKYHQRVVPPKKNNKKKEIDFDGYDELY